MEGKKLFDGVKNIFKSIDKGIMDTGRSLETKWKNYKDKEPERRAKRIQRLKDEAEIEKHQLKLEDLRFKRKKIKERREKLNQRNDNNIWF